MQYDRFMGKHLIWKLPSYLEAHGLTCHQLMQEVGDGKGQIAYKWSALPERLDIDALARVMGALEKLTGAEVSISDVLDYAPALPPRDSDLAEAGLSDYVSDLAALEQDLNPADLADWNAAFKRV